MAELNVDALSVMQMIQANNGSSQSGNLIQAIGISFNNGSVSNSAEDVENLVSELHRICRSI
jgi:hypothetical protein